MSATLSLAEQLIALPSVTPDDAGCQTLIAERLRPRGFDCTALPFGPEGKRVSNLWAHRPGSDAGRQAAGLRRPHRRRPDRAARRLEQRSVRADASRRQALRPRRRRHEELDRRHGRGRRGVRRRPAGASRRHRPPDHQRRGRARRSTARRASATGWSSAASASTTASSASRPRSSASATRSRTAAAAPSAASCASSACRATSPTRSWRRTRSTWSRRRWPSWSASTGTAATRTSSRPPGRCRTSMPAPAPATSSRARSSSTSTSASAPQSTPESLKARVDLLLRKHGLAFEIAWTLGGEPFLTTPGDAQRRAGRVDPRARRHRLHALHLGRHLRRPLHQEDLQGADRVRPGQREHPQDRRMHRGGEPRGAEERLPRRPGAAGAHDAGRARRRAERAPEARRRLVRPRHRQRLRRGRLAGDLGDRPAARRARDAAASAR